MSWCSVLVLVLDLVFVLVLRSNSLDLHWLLKGKLSSRKVFMYEIYIEQCNYLLFSVWVFSCVLGIACHRGVQLKSNLRLMKTFWQFMRAVTGRYQKQKHISRHSFKLSTIYHIIARPGSQCSLDNKFGLLWEKKLIHLSFHETLPDVKGKIFT